MAELARVVTTSVFRVVFGSLAARRSTLLLALNPDVERRFRRYHARISVQSNTALPPGLLSSLDAHRATSGTRPIAVYAGRLLPWKGLRAAIRCLQYASDWTLIIFGEGPDKAPLLALAHRLGVEARVQLRGTATRRDVMNAMAAADAFLFPSFHDSAGAAAAEASALGCPVICLDLGGPPLQAGRNAHVVRALPARTLPKRLASALADVAGHGAPDNHLGAERLSDLLRQYYSGSTDGVT